MPLTCVPLPVEPPDLPYYVRGYMPLHDAQAIIGLLRSIGAQRVVEFGVNIGGTAATCMRFVPTITHYHGIDVPPNYKPALDVQRGEIPSNPGRLVQHDPRFRLTVRPRGSLELNPDNIGEVDAALIDGDHSRGGVIHDTALARACVRPGGIILWHDYHAESVVDVPAVLDEMAAAGDPIVHLDGTWLAYEQR